MIFMKSGIGRAVGVIAVFLSAESLPAHHGFRVVFDDSKEITLTGTLTKVDWINPHIELSLAVKSDRGAVEAWVIEAGPPSFFRGRNISRSEFEKGVGQTVTVEVLRAKNGSPLGSLLKVTFADGKSVTSSPGA